MLELMVINLTESVWKNPSVKMSEVFIIYYSTNLYFIGSVIISSKEKIASARAALQSLTRQVLVLLPAQCGAYSVHSALARGFSHLRIVQTGSRVYAVSYSIGRAYRCFFPGVKAATA
jgi:hypothetical protein